MGDLKMVRARSTARSRSPWVVVAAIGATLFVPTSPPGDFGAGYAGVPAAYAQSDRQTRVTRYNDSMYCDENGYRWVRQRVSLSGSGGSASVPLRCDWVGLDKNRKRQRN